MKPFAESLWTETEKTLEAIHCNAVCPISLSEEAVGILTAALDKLKLFFVKKNIRSKAEEIAFFRDIKPQFAGRLIHYNNIYKIEIRKPLGSKKSIRKYYQGELQKLKEYFEDNRQFYKYYRTGSTYLDNLYFIRGQHDVRLILDNYYLQADHAFSTSHDYKVAMIIANELTQKYLETQMENLLSNTMNEFAKQRKPQKWTGSKVALVELVYALHTEGVFNHGSSDLKEIASFFESAFQVDLKQLYRTFLEIRERKSDRTKFLNTLKDKLIHFMDEADEN